MAYGTTLFAGSRRVVANDVPEAAPAMDSTHLSCIRPVKRRRTTQIRVGVVRVAFWVCHEALDMTLGYSG
jgi:hypothetical protein